MPRSFVVSLEDDARRSSPDSGGDRKAKKHKKKKHKHKEGKDKKRRKHSRDVSVSPPPGQPRSVSPAAQHEAKARRPPAQPLQGSTVDVRNHAADEPAAQRVAAAAQRPASPEPPPEKKKRKHSRGDMDHAKAEALAPAEPAASVPTGKPSMEVLPLCLVSISEVLHQVDPRGIRVRFPHADVHATVASTRHLIHHCHLHQHPMHSPQNVDVHIASANRTASHSQQQGRQRPSRPTCPSSSVLWLTL